MTQKIVIIGGSSFSTVALLEYLAESRIDVTRAVVLVGQNSEALSAVSRAGNLLDSRGALRITTADVRAIREAMSGADVVLIQFRAGGYGLRDRIEQLAGRYGVIGDEALGVGGVCAAWNAWPVLEHYLATVSEVAPNADVVLLTSPPGLLTRCVHLAGITVRVIGICELPSTTLLEIRRRVGLSGGVDADYLGVNHLGWFTRLEADGVDVLQRYSSSVAGSDVYPGPAEIEKWGAIPTRYVALYDRMSRVISDQALRAVTRGSELERLRAKAIFAYSTGDVTEVRASLLGRPTPWYVDAVGPLFDGLSGAVMPHTLYLSVANEGWHSGFARDDVLEIPHRVQAGRLQRLPGEPLASRRIMSFLVESLEFEASAAAAIIAQCETEIRKVAIDHPWIRGHHSVDKVAMELFPATA